MIPALVRLRVLISLRLCACAPLRFNFLISLHAAFHAEGGCYGGQYRRQRLKNELPCFLFHSRNVFGNAKSLSRKVFFLSVFAPLRSDY